MAICHISHWFFSTKAVDFIQIPTILKSFIQTIGTLSILYVCVFFFSFILKWCAFRYVDIVTINRIQEIYFYVIAIYSYSKKNLDYSILYILFFDSFGVIFCFKYRIIVMNALTTWSQFCVENMQKFYKNAKKNYLSAPYSEQ